ncbi:PAS domain S-box protein [Mucilaginibacter sp. 14171R-50]|uniref:PAS domain-containing protein n=1 Tax=Mucilaginibacter sp. 14171R-50 TaxID=2703789 RepID=UPI00138DC2EE|nr:PAS domain S-box protein [Mucilaginibacter sp. 14171R-50]QHS55426.1 PAS domain S-box protein [Mucilaginibacter sp. 14171R-50]
MKIPFTPQLLGDLIEKGYTHVLASTVADGHTNLVLKPVREKPKLNNLPSGFETFYKITREPMQMACGVEDVIIEVDYATLNQQITGEDVFEDSYFRMSEDFFRQVLDSLEDYAVFTTDKNGDVNSWNSGAERVLGYTENEAMGLCADVFFTPEDVAKGAPAHELVTALNDGRAIDERYHVRKNGSRFWGSGLVFPLFDEEGHHRGFTKIMRNLREQEQAKAEGSDL